MTVTDKRPLMIFGNKADTLFVEFDDHVSL